MSSFGQAAGMVIGGVIGFFAGGNVALGASIGGAIGGYIDPPKGPKIEGPRLSDLSVQTGTYGAPIPRVYGAVGISGNVIWVEGGKIKETSKTESQGGKGGGGGAETTTYSYSVTCAIGICQGPISGIRRIWCANQLIFDAGSTDADAFAANAFEWPTNNAINFKASMPEMAGGSSALPFTLYLGTDDQQPDPTIQADLGVSNTPAWRGLAYVVLTNFALEKYGNSMAGAQFKFEVMSDQTSSNNSALTATLTYPQYVDSTWMASTVVARGEQFDITSLIYNGFDTTLFEVHSQSVFFGSPSSVSNGSVDLPVWEGGINNGNSPAVTLQSDEDIFFFFRGVALINTTQLLAYNRAGELVLDTGEFSNTYLPYGVYRIVVDSGDIYLAGDGKIYHIARTISPEPYRITESADSFNIIHFGASPNYLFLVIQDGSQTTTTIKKVSRANLDVVETIAVSINSRWTVIRVASDNVFYLLEGYSGGIFKVTDGVLSYTGMTYLGPAQLGITIYLRFFVIADSMAVIFPSSGGSDSTEVYTCFRSVAPSLVNLSDIIESECMASGVLEAADIDTSEIDQDVRGYRVAAAGSIRSALEPLQGAWPFDAFQDGYKIKFVPRGQSSVATIPIEDLGAVAGNEKQVFRVKHSREMDLQLPRAVKVSYIDSAREYAEGAGPGAQRSSTDAVNTATIQLPIVLTADEAAQVEERLLYLYWLERHDIQFVLPPTYRALQPADVVTVTGINAIYDVRLTEINYLPDGRMECAGKFNNPAIYASTAVGQEGLSVGQSLTYTGVTQFIELDIPRVAEYQDATGFPFAMYGYSPGWDGGILAMSNDSGITYNALAAASHPARVFTVASALAVASPYSVDRDSVLVVTALAPTADLFAVTESQVFAHYNLAALGADDRWEIIAFAGVTDAGAGQFTIKTFLRGLFGTESAIPTHTATDLLVMLDADRLAVCPMTIQDLNMPRLYRAVTDGKTIDGAFDISGTYTAENLKPLAPIAARSYKPSATSDYNISWTRRTRTPVEVFSGAAVPLGETTEAYEVDIWNANWSAIVRTVTGLASANMTYTLAQMITDFGEEQTAVNMDIYQMSTVVGRGKRLRTVIRRPGIEGQFASYIISGLHFNGTNGSTTFRDVVPSNVWGASGNAQIVTDAAAFGGFSGSFDGTGDYIALGNGGNLVTPGVDEDWTLSGWVTPASVTTVRGFVSTRVTSPTGFGWQLYSEANGSVAFVYHLSHSVTVYIGGGSLTLNARNYIALSKKGRVYYLFVNGAKVDERTENSPIYIVGASSLVYGRFTASGAHPQYDFTGKLDDWRIHKGACLYEYNFSPPTDAFVDR